MKPLILAGGGGTRLWPFSTNETPKQFLDLVTPKVSLIRGTFDRLIPFAKPEDIFISTGEIYAEKSLEHCPIPQSNLVLEPARRNNAPAIGLSLITMLEHGATEDDVVVLFPSDHLIANTDLFTRACLFSEKIIKANPGAVLTWGIEPTYPETGYGYIEVASEVIGQEA
jgi:mannose-1-phosphate guanylyltransferase